MIIRDESGNTNRVKTGLLHVILTIGTILILLSLQKCYDYKVENKEINNLLNAASDSLHKTRNELNQEISRIETLQSTNSDLFTSLEFKDKEIKHLQSIVKAAEKRNIELNTALVISNRTNIELRDSIKNLIDGWESNNDDSLVSYPIYKRDFTMDSCYTQGSIRMGLTTFDLKLSFDNSFDVIIGEEKVNMFKKKQFAEITNLNPCTTTKTLRVYDKIEKKNNTIKVFGYGVGTGAIGIILLSLLL